MSQTASATTDTDTLAEDAENFRGKPKRAKPRPIVAARPAVARVCANEIETDTPETEVYAQLR